MKTKNNNNKNIRIEDELAVIIPNGKQIMLNKTMMLDIPGVPEEANKAQIIPELTSGNLLSIVQYCNSNCSAHFYKTKMIIKIRKETRY